MKFIPIVLSSLFLAGPPVFGFTAVTSKITQTDGSISDVQAAINAASNGTAIQLPAGNFTWSTALTINRKAVHLQGAGAGRIVGRSLTSNVIETGSKTFETQAGLPLSNGDTVRIARTAYRDFFMEGKVTSYSGTSLTVNVTAKNGTGTFGFWWIATNPATVITHNLPGGILVTANESTVGSIEISGIKFQTTQGGEAKVMLLNTSGPSGSPVLIHDCWISLGTSAGGIRVNTNKGVVWNCSFDCEFPYPGGTNSEAFQWAAYAESDSWSTPSSMGAADTTGKKNFYVEDCDFHSFRHFGDFDANSRVVVRHCLMNNSGCSSHGADTGPIGLRHYEFYNNEFIFNNFGESDGSKTIALDWWLFNRGGTGVITDNIMPELTSTSWGSKTSILMTVMNLRRNSSDFACWGANQPGVQWPAPHQIGQGHDGNTTILEPLYIWNNQGNVRIGSQDDSPNQCGEGADWVADYVQAGRDYYADGTAKPGYQKYVYPHPLRVANGPPSPGNLHVVAP